MLILKFLHSAVICITGTWTLLMSKRVGSKRSVATIPDYAVNILYGVALDFLYCLRHS